MEGFQRFLEPPRLRTATAERYEERHATWLELFLDLVFVVAIAQLGTAFAHEPTGPGFLRFLGLFVPIVWAWAGFTFYATRFDTDDLVYRALTLLGMFGVAALATTVPSAFEGSGNGFALAYAGIRLVIVVLYVRAWRHVVQARQLATWFLQMFTTAIVFWLVSVAVPSPWKYVLWGVALAFELGCAAAGLAAHARRTDPPRAHPRAFRAPDDHRPRRGGDRRRDRHGGRQLDRALCDFSVRGLPRGGLDLVDLLRIPRLVRRRPERLPRDDVRLRPLPRYGRDRGDGRRRAAGDPVGGTGRPLRARRLDRRRRNRDLHGRARRDPARDASRRARRGRRSSLRGR